MPYLFETQTGKTKIRDKLENYCKGQFTEDEIQGAEKLEIWGSSFNDPGEDWCEYRLFFPGGKQKAIRIPGY